MKPHSYDQALFPDLTPPPVQPRSQEEVDVQIAAIAAVADQKTVEVIDVASEAASDQGHSHQTPRFGMRRPTADGSSTAGGALFDADSPLSDSRFSLTQEEINRGKANLAALREQYANSDRHVYPSI